MPDNEDRQTGADELRRSRARVVAAGDAERRRIERELHDGPQQRLVALAVELQRARLLAEDASPELVELLDAIAADVRAALEELRELAERVYPPLLDGAALAATLRAALERMPVPVEVEAEPLGTLPELVATAAHLCCLDAVENAAAHAGAGARARVVLARDGDDFRFEVADDGVGFDPEKTPAGAGLTRISDRVVSLGGRVTVDSSDGHGTRLVATIPLGR